MTVFLFAVAGLTVLALVSGRLLLRRLHGLQTTLSMILLSTLYFLILLQLAHRLIGSGT
jgi:ABC-type enterochelin transport system permease subunit